MNEMNPKIDFKFFAIAMPKTRPADYYLGCLGGSIFMDFDNCEDELIRLKRISFDGYGCCDLGNLAIPMDIVDSSDFKKIIGSGLSSNQSRLTTIVKKVISSNKELIWKDALNEYGLS